MLRIEGYVIVSADGMLAAADGVMPPSLRFPADQKFFEGALDNVDLIVHGRHSYEDQPKSPHRKRIIATRAVAGIDIDPANPKATLWNPAGASFEEACKCAGITSGVAAIIGGPDIFAMFFDRYDTFWLSQAATVRIPDGIGAFPGIPPASAQSLLTQHGLQPSETRTLDAGAQVTVTAWRRGNSSS